jgi:hypothetical protein
MVTLRALLQAANGAKHADPSRVAIKLEVGTLLEGMETAPLEVIQWPCLGACKLIHPRQMLG